MKNHGTIYKPSSWEANLAFACRWHRRLTGPQHTEKTKLNLAKFIADHATATQLFFLEWLSEGATIREIFAQMEIQINA